MQDTLSAFATHLRVHKEPRTVATYGAALSSLAAFLGTPKTLAVAPSPGEVEAFIGRRRKDGDERARSTRNQDLAAIRAFAKFAMRDLGWKADPTAGIRFAKRVRRAQPVPTRGEVRELFLAANDDDRAFFRTRDSAMLAVFTQAGTRGSELVNLDVDRIDLAGANILGMHRKGGASQDIPLNARATRLLDAWLKVRADFAGADEPALFLSARRTRVSLRTVERVVATLRVRAGVTKRVSPHGLRRGFATQLHQAGGGLLVISNLLGHASVQTTQDYVFQTEAEQRAAVQLLENAIPDAVLSEAKVSKPMEGVARFSEASSSSPPEPLDDQCGLSAKGRWPPPSRGDSCDPIAA